MTTFIPHSRKKYAAEMFCFSVCVRTVNVWMKEFPPHHFCPSWSGTKFKVKATSYQPKNNPNATRLKIYIQMLFFVWLLTVNVYEIHSSWLFSFVKWQEFEKKSIFQFLLLFLTTDSFFIFFSRKFLPTVVPRKVAGIGKVVWCRILVTGILELISDFPKIERKRKDLVLESG